MHDTDKANKAIGFFENVLHFTKGRWRGQPFKLMQWQRDLLSDLFGTVNGNGLRQYKTAMVNMPKKNGKSELAGGLALYMLCADHEKAPEVYSAAASTEQASIIFDIASTMVRMSPALSKRIKIIDSRKRMIDKASGGFYKVISRAAETAYGINASCIIFDEISVQKDRNLYDILTVGSGAARQQPVVFCISNAGHDRQSICYELFAYGRKVEQGTIEDKSFLPVLYCIDDTDDWESEENWIKANPALDTIFSIDDIREHYRRALETPGQEAIFRMLRCGQWVSNVSEWIPYKKWAACAGTLTVTKKKGRERYLERLEGRDCILGLDLSSTLDLSCLAAITLPTEDDPYFYVFVWPYLPEERIEEKSRKDKAPWSMWARAGLLALTPGEVIEYSFIKEQIMWCAKHFNVLSFGFDPWNANTLVQEVMAEGDLEMVSIRQGYKTLSPACKEFEKLIYTKQIIHGGNLLLSHCLQNTMIEQDPSGNIKPSKRASNGRIDPVTALVTAMARVIPLTATPEAAPTLSFIDL